MVNGEMLRRIASDPDALVRYVARDNFEAYMRYQRPDLDVAGFHRNYYRVLDLFAHKKIKRLIISASPQHGKALWVNTPVLTTKGWKKHGQLQVDDYVFGADGNPKRVEWISGNYMWHTQEVCFTGGFSLVAAKEHEWRIWADHDDHRGRVQEIVETQSIFAKRHRRNPYIEADAVLKCPRRRLPIDPYKLGLWLGDGNSRDKWISCGVEDLPYLAPMAKEIKKDRTAYKVHLDGLETRDLRLMGELMNKHIPDEYLLASEEQRMALLRGLMDTDGCANTRGTCEFTQKSGRLADDVCILLRTLGIKPNFHEYDMKLNGKVVGRKMRVMFNPDAGQRVFGFERKQFRIDFKQTADRDDKKKFFISGVYDHCDCEVNCIQVEGGMYLAGPDLVPTHNSEGSSRGLPTFIEGLNPDTKLVIASYSLAMARQFNRACQRLMGSFEYKSLYPESMINDSGVRQYNTYQCSADQTDMVGRQGFIKAVGRGGGLTGIPVDVAILDDIYKDFKEANSPIIREQAWNWYTSVVRTRLHKDSQELIVFTRWHEDDIIGRIEKSGEPIVVAKSWSDLEDVPDNAWVLVNFPAIKVGEPTEIDPREPGRALWPERHPLEELEERRRLDPNLFECLYQGDPGSAEGRLYRPFRTYADKAEWGRCIRRGAYIDVADEGDDYLAAVCYDVYLSPNRFYDEKKRRYVPLLYALVTDIVYTQDDTSVTYVTVPNMLNLNGTKKAWVESNAGGAQFEKNIRPKVRARTEAFHQRGNKESRIVSNAAEVNDRIIFPVGWESRWPEVYAHLSRFLRYFKGNTHDDIEDALTGVYEKEIADGRTHGYGGGAMTVRRVN